MRPLTILSRLAVLAVLAAPVGAQEHRHSRDEWQKVPEIFAALGVKPGIAVAEIGAGSGYFISHLARTVGPAGRIFAVDIDSGSIRRLQDSVKAGRWSQVSVVRGEVADPKLAPGSLDAALIVNAYHEMTEAAAILGHLRTALRPGGRLVIAEPISRWGRKHSREQQAEYHQVAVAFVVEDLRRAGFEVVELQDPFLDHPGGGEYWLLAARPLPASRAASAASRP